MTANAYVTDDTGTIAAYRAGRRRQSDWFTRVTAEAERMGSAGPSVIGDWVHPFGIHLTGLVAKRENFVPVVPEGWRYVKRRGCLRPAAGRAGAEAKAWLESNQPPSPNKWLRELGLDPSSVSRDDSAGQSWHARVEVTDLGGRLVALYRYEQHRAPSDVWQPILLSQYHAALESHQAVAS